MEDKSVIINKIIADTGAKSYLEIGYGTGHNFNKIKCLAKLGVEPKWKKDSGAVYPGTSDEFFDDNESDFDVVFIDGLHHAEQVRKDIVNAMKCNPKAIILHDTLPPDEAHQIVPRQQKQWCGDVYKAAVGFHKKYPEVRFETYRSDYGLSVIYPEGFKATRKHFEKIDMTFEEFKKNEVNLLNIID